MSYANAVLVLLLPVLAFASFVALVIGWRRKEPAGIRRVLATVAVCAAIALPCWLVSSALRANEQRPWLEARFGADGRNLAKRAGIDVDPARRFDRDVLVEMAPFAWFPALAAALLGTRLRLRTSRSEETACASSS